MKIAQSAKQYISDARTDLISLKDAIFEPMHRAHSVAVAGFAGASALYWNATIAFAATPLFDKLKTATEALYSDAQDLVSTVATLALVLSLIGLLVASVFGPKATANMTTAIKFIIVALIVWHLIPVIMSTLEVLFGSGGGGGGGGATP